MDIFSKKLCYECNEEKQLFDFGHCKTNCDGFNNRCLECLKAKNRARHKKYQLPSNSSFSFNQW